MRQAKHIAVIGQKGGSGKTPTSANLAVIAADHGWTPVILDIDPEQASATKWGDRRGDRTPAVVVVPCLPARLKPTLTAIPEQGFDLVITDTPGRQSTISIDAATGADLVLVPCRPILNDTDTLPNVKRMVELAGSPPSLVVITCAETQGTRHIDAAELARNFEIIDEQGNVTRIPGFDVAPVVLFDRVAYGDSHNIGLAPTEFEPRGKAALELIALYDYISKFINNDRIR
jgi:chromosome partitioning protein